MSEIDTVANALLVQCRAGFERDAVEELASAGGAGAGIVAIEGGGYVLTSWRGALKRIPSLDRLIFARQWILTHEAPLALNVRDRVGPLVAAVRRELSRHDIQAVTECRVEYPDTNTGKTQSSTARAIAPMIAERLAAAGCLSRGASWRAHAFLLPGLEAWVGISPVVGGSAWPLGIPRLRMPSGAPSRSTLKLAEAIEVFLGPSAARWLRPGMRAVDLGAAPGGWTWQLVQHGLWVTAIDNGSLKGELVGHAQVRHLRADGFRYLPERPVDWLVCDMVERPIRVAELVAKWLAEGHARHAIFNLKLPMKKRLAEVARCRDLILAQAAATRRPVRLVVKQLYHDREEVTAFATTSRH